MNKDICIIKGDSIKIMPTLEQRFNAAIVDPPYNTANKNTKILKGRKDRTADFGDWDYYSEQEFLSFTKQWVGALSNCLTDNANAIIFCKMENISKIIAIYEELGFKHHATIIWHKTNPAIQIRKRGFLSSCEAILWATKGFTENKIEYTFNFNKQSEMHNFIETPICMGKERLKHPTQKPKKLIRRLLEIFTNEGDYVIDCFAGSGTTAEACLEMNRKCLAIEIDENYFSTMLTRLENNCNSLFRDQLEVINNETENNNG